MSVLSKLFSGKEKKPGDETETVYTFAGVPSDNETARSIQHNIDLLRYLAEHRHLNKDTLATYLEMCERFGMGTHPQKSELLAASSQMTRAQASQLRSALANVHVEELTDCIRKLKSAPPILETVKMIEYVVKTSDALKKYLL